MGRGFPTGGRGLFDAARTAVRLDFGGTDRVGGIDATKVKGGRFRKGGRLGD